MSSEPGLFLSTIKTVIAVHVVKALTGVAPMQCPGCRKLGLYQTRTMFFWNRPWCQSCADERGKRSHEVPENVVTLEAFA